MVSRAGTGGGAEPELRDRARVASHAAHIAAGARVIHDGPVVADEQDTEEPAAAAPALIPAPAPAPAPWPPSPLSQSSQFTSSDPYVPPRDIADSVDASIAAADLTLQDSTARASATAVLGRVRPSEEPPTRRPRRMSLAGVMNELLGAIRQPPQVSPPPPPTHNWQIVDSPQDDGSKVLFCSHCGIFKPCRFSDE
jgi:hypothetical protein